MYHLFAAESVPQPGVLLIQLTSTGVDFNGTQEDMDSLRTKYLRDNYIIFPRLYEPSLFEKIMQRVQAAPFEPHDHGDEIGHEFCMADQTTAALLDFPLNNPAFLRIIEHITGHSNIGRFWGRVYRLTDSAEQSFNWHTDANEGRVATMSINLSPQIFEGGALQLKRRGSDEILQEVYNTGLGDAVLFRISDDLFHRVLGVKGKIPKTAFAGWFREGEDFLPNIEKILKSSRARAG